METVTKFFGQDPESKLKAAETAVESKKKELADAESALAAAKTAVSPSSGTIGSDGVQGGRRRKTRRRGAKKRKSTRSRK